MTDGFRCPGDAETIWISKGEWKRGFLWRSREVAEEAIAELPDPATCTSVGRNLKNQYDGEKIEQESALVVR